MQVWSMFLPINILKYYNKVENKTSCDDFVSGILVVSIIVITLMAPSINFWK